MKGAKMSTVLIIEDDMDLQEGLAYSLEAEGYSIIAASTMEEGEEQFRKNACDLILLDCNLPDGSGFEFCERIRRLAQTPVLMLTARDSELDEVKALNLGADDYLTKPFGVMELVSRVKAVLRRCRPVQQQVLRCGGLAVDTQEHTVTADGVRVELTYKEFQLLRLFLSHMGTAFTRDQLMEQVWGMDFCGESRTIDMHIRTLRQKLGAYGEHIETVRSVGYRWRAQL